MTPLERAPKVLLVTNIPTPYRIPLFNELNKQLAEAGFDLKVVFGAYTYGRRKWVNDLSECGFDYIILESYRISHRGIAEHTTFLYGGLCKLIRKSAPDLVVVPAFSVATMKIWLWSLFRKTPYLIWTGSVQRDGHSGSRWRMWQRRLLAGRAAGAIAYGSKAKSYLVSLGIPEPDVYIAVNTVDTAFFKTQTAKIKGCIARTKPRHYLLYVGHLTRGKRLDRLFYILKWLGETRSDFCLQIVGEGPEEEALRLLLERLQIESLVSFEGFVQKEDLPAYLAQADCFLFPSEYDIWGLVLNEAMAAGLPCVASVQAGATCDLIEDGVTGFAVDFADTEYVAEKVNWILDHPEEAMQIGQRASRHIAEHVDLQHSAAGFVQAVRGTCS